MTSKRLPFVAGALMCFACLGPAIAESNTRGDGPTALQTAESERYEALSAQRSKSADLRVRILYSLGAGFAADPGAGPRAMWRERVPASTLYDDARGSTDPLTLSLLIKRCDAPTRAQDGCDRLELARRWTMADTQNQVAWLTLAGVLRDRGDLDGAQSTFRRAALASRWHDSYNDIARLLAKQIPADASATERGDLLVEALGKAGLGDYIDALQILWTHCKDDALREPCGRIVQTMARDTETLLGATFAVRYAVKAQLDATLVASYQRKADAIRWTMPWLFTSDVDTAEGIARLGRLVDAGERHGAELVLSEQRVSEAEAARRYAAGLTPGEVERRAKMLAGNG